MLVTTYISRHVSEDESDRRGIKVGWYTVGKRGVLGRGPFASFQDCEQEIARPTRGHLAASLSSRGGERPFKAWSSWLPKQVRKVVPTVRLTWAGPFWITE